MGRGTYLLTTEFERLEEWCSKVRIMLHEQPYLVGSALERPDYRDVDVRVLMEDGEFDRSFARAWPHVTGRFDPRRVRFLNRAISAWGQAETGLRIDFQVQRRTDANLQYDGQRNPMGTRDWNAIATSGVPDPEAPVGP